MCKIPGIRIPARTRLLQRRWRAKKIFLAVRLEVCISLAWAPYFSGIGAPSYFAYVLAGTLALSACLISFAVLRIRAEGLTRKLCTITLTTPLPEEFDLYGGEAVYASGRVIGRLRSAGWGYTVGKHIG